MMMNKIMVSDCTGAFVDGGPGSGPQKGGGSSRDRTHAAAMKEIEQQHGPEVAAQWHALVQERNAANEAVDANPDSAHHETLRERAQSKLNGFHHALQTLQAARR
jgi:hypothetical protein